MMERENVNPENLEPVSEAALTRLLERTGEPRIPDDFAARVRSVLPATPPPHRRSVRVGRRLRAARFVAASCAVLIALALFLLAPHTPPSAASFAFWMEMLLLLELGGIVYWLGVRGGLAE